MKTTRFDQLDGFRAFAIFLVVASHTYAFGMTGQGGLGVALFFALSGFLLAVPWTQDGEERFCSVSSILIFYLKRFLRLIPPYYLVLLSVYWVTGSSENLLGNLLFFNCQGHLWFLQQEVLFYFFAPFLVLLLFFLKKKCRLGNFCLGFLLLAASCLFQKYFTARVFYLMGNGKEQSFRIGLFLAGMAFAYFLKSWNIPCIKATAAKLAADLVCIAFIGFCVFSSAFFLQKIDPSLSSYYIGWNRPLLCAAGSGVFLVLILANPDGIVSRLLKLPVFVSIGRLSYGIYLIHFFLIPYAPFATPSKVFFAVFFVSLGVAMIIQKWIEEPLQRLSSRLDRLNR